VPSLLEALDDPRLLGAGFSPHPRQRELAETIEAHRLTVACCGRRFGKTRMASAAALHNLLLVPELDELVARGERRYAVSVANNTAQARLFVEHAASIVKASPELARELVSETVDALEFRGGRVLAGFPCTARGGRGWPISFLVLDEFAHAYEIEEGGPATAQRLWAAMRPSTAQFRELGRTVVISTPAGSDGKFAELYAQALGGELAGAAAFHAPTSTNPLIDRDYLAAEEVALGHDDFRREFGAEFLAGGASFIEASRIRDVVADWREALPTDGVDWVLAFDAAFASDPAAVAVVGRSPLGRTRLICGYTQRWLPPKSRRRLRRSRDEDTRLIESVIADVAAVASRFRARVIVDQHLPGVVVNEFAKHGVHATVRAWTAESRTQAAQAVRARIYTQRIELPDDPQLIAELSRLRTKYRAGSATVEIPKVGDSHCDVAVALLAAVGEHDRHGVGGATVMPRLGFVEWYAGGPFDPTRVPAGYEPKVEKPTVEDTSAPAPRAAPPAALAWRSQRSSGGVWDKEF
jgi:hypothetical protein